jgi:hypothetical protein
VPGEEGYPATAAGAGLLSRIEVMLRSLRLAAEGLCYLWAASGLWVLFMDNAQADARYIGIPMSIGLLVIALFLTYKRIKVPK